MQKKYKYIFIAALLIAAVSYGAVEAWFSLTDGFRLAHISSNLEPDTRWNTREVTDSEQKAIDEALSQTYSYIGKGCQSYVFVSEDEKYILKFIKYVRYRPQFYFYWFTFLPEFKQYLDLKIDLKNQKLARLFSSWITAYDLLTDETALIYTHLNKTNTIQRRVTIRDYAGFTYELDIDQMEFLIQKKGTELCSEIDCLMAEGKEDKTKEMLSGLFQLILSEYKRGIADNDHALMQNTGVINGKAFQLDVGAFVVDPLVSDPSIYHQQLFNKYYKFRFWLGEHHPSLLDHVNQELINEMGESFYSLNYIPSR